LLRLSAHDPWLWLAPLVAAVAVTASLTPLAIRAANRFGTIDRPVGQKIHSKPTPLLGGVAVYAGFLLVAILFLPFDGPVRGILAGGAIATTIGVLDDRLSLPPLIHLGGQICAAVVTIVVGLGVVRSLNNPFASAAQIASGKGGLAIPIVLGLAFTIFWIVGMMNTINFLDGLDGLSSGVGIIAALLLAWWASHPNVANYKAMTLFGHAELVLPIILAGALLGFLPFNWHPARAFIGDSGVMFLGLGLGGISLLGATKIGTALLILSIPVLDVAWAIVRRQLHGKSFLTGDKQHVYHRMIELGMSQMTTVISLYALCVALGVMDLQLARKEKLVAVAIVMILAGLGFVGLEIAGNRRNGRQSAQESRGEIRT
jgi:UDP-GlcNAc:undecaprenyl-phosphate GlcNAc-1-phosphate transferase